MDRPADSHKFVLEGAEAILTPVYFAGLPALKKERHAKPYRPVSLDKRIRSTRTKVEARLLAKAKMAGVPCPSVLAVGKNSITLSKLEGVTLHALEAKAVPVAIWTLSGQYLAQLHAAKIIHGDYTPANLMMTPGQHTTLALSVIDFGLGAISHDEEDYAVDVVTMKKALPQKEAKAFLEGYSREGGAGAKRVLKLVKEIESRARYQDRGAG